MLSYAYKHIGGENNPLVPGLLPTDPLNGYSHSSVTNLSPFGYTSADQIKDVRFYCNTSAHNRKIHFSTSNSGVINMAYTGMPTGNTASRWNTGFNPLDGHTGNLPQSTTGAWSDTGFTPIPFYNDGTYYWSIRANTGAYRWECDDSHASIAYNTLHQVWVRMKSKASPRPTSAPSTQPSTAPSLLASTAPSMLPSSSTLPSTGPSTLPSSTPSTVPSEFPSMVPSPSPSGAPSMLPSSVPSTSPSSAPSVACYESCNHLYWETLEAGDTSASGQYHLCPTGDQNNIFSAYCDQVTGGGGWMLLYAYKHIGGQNNALVLNTLPTDPINGYSQTSVTNLSAFGYTTADQIKDVRFYCQTSGHTRKIHFYTNNPTVINMAYTGSQTGNAASHWTTGFAPLDGHTGLLPERTNSADSNGQGFGGLAFPFYRSNNYHWSIQGNGNRWECDDYPNNSARTTLHQVWVRMKATPTVPCYESCSRLYLETLAAGDSPVSGQYYLCPSGDQNNRFLAYCDQVTAGGGWMLTQAYNHVGGQNNGLVGSLLPTDPNNGYSHSSVTKLSPFGYTSASQIKDVRFYCHTSGHTRKIHFYTNLSPVINMAYTGGLTGNSAYLWQNGFVPLDGHTGFLPASTSSVGNNGEGFVDSFPFFRTNNYHWSIQGNGNRWECDDYPNNFAHSTLHQVWVRMKAVP
jgi:hypothetical protein